MRQALREAEKAGALGEVPVGCVIVKDDRVIARGHNTRETKKNALFHAETVAIDKACRKLGGWRLPGCELYVTLEPCPMCAGAVINARVDRVYAAVRDPKAGAMGSVVDLTALPFNHKPTISYGLCEDEAKELLQSFFARLRQKRTK
ncbi:MAG: nucleoside deaminase [Clostridia bacterium]|nr:nucleoside deaminase [Clostridia bacterium]